MAVIDRAEALAAAGQAAAGRTSLEQAAMAGDGDAAFALAFWYLVVFHFYFVIQI
jgi:hypothetical protein